MRPSVVFMVVAVILCVVGCHGNNTVSTGAAEHTMTVAKIKADALTQIEGILAGNYDAGKSWQCYGLSAERSLNDLFDKVGVSENVRSEYLVRFRESNKQEALRLLAQARKGKFEGSGYDFKDNFYQCIGSSDLGESGYTEPPFNTSWRELSILSLTGDLKWADHMIDNHTESGTMLTIKVDNLLFSPATHDMTLEQMGFTQAQIVDRRKRARAVEIEDVAKGLRDNSINATVSRFKDVIAEYNGFDGQTVTYEDYQFTEAELNALQAGNYTKKANLLLSKAYAEDFSGVYLGYYLEEADSYAEALGCSLRKMAIEMGIPEVAFDRMVQKSGAKLASAH